MNRILALALTVAAAAALDGPAAAGPVCNLNTGVELEASPVTVGEMWTVTVDGAAFGPGKEADFLKRYYPDRALRMEVEGDVRLRCTASAGRIRSCEVLSESPSDQEFGLRASRLLTTQGLATGAGDVGSIGVSVVYRIPDHGHTERNVWVSAPGVCNKTGRR